MKLFNSQSGDTIVEVLIALTIVSVVMIGAFITTNATQSHIQDNQEHSQALQLGQAQIEYLRRVNELDVALYKCFDSAGNPSAAAANACKFSTTGTRACDLTVDPYCYVVNITRTDVTGSDSQYTYAVEVVWDRLSGGSGKIDLTYRPPGARQVSIIPDLAPGEAIIDRAGRNNDNDTGNGCGNTCNDTGRVTYTRTLTIVDYSNNLTVASCTWQWGDGTSQTYSSSARECQIGQKVRHDYPDDPRLPNNSACTQGEGDLAPIIKRYNVVVILKTSDGQTITSQRATVSSPYCS